VKTLAGRGARLARLDHWQHASKGSRSLGGFARYARHPIVFVTGYRPDTVERIHQQVPGAPVVPNPVYRDHLADAVAVASVVTETRHPSADLQQHT
jgi:hypothetical protein